MAITAKPSWRDVLADVQQRLPVGQQFAQEAFTSDHRHLVMVKVNQLRPDTFYWFDEMTVCALFEAVMDDAVHRNGGRLTLSYTASDELKAHVHRLQHAASKLEQIRVLSVGRPLNQIRNTPRLDYFDIAGTPLAPYRIVLAEGRIPRLFIVREERSTAAAAPRSLGFFSSDGDMVDEMAEEIEALTRGIGRRLATFERLQQLHQTTQQISRELESYARRMELAVQRARRRPDLLTPARFERIVAQSISKLETLKEIPQRALRAMNKPQR